MFHIFCCYIRTEVLDKAISLVEGLSAVDGFLETVSFKEKLVQCLCKILKASDKFEVRLAFKIK